MTSIIRPWERKYTQIKRYKRIIHLLNGVKLFQNLSRANYKKAIKTFKKAKKWFGRDDISDAATSNIEVIRFLFGLDSYKKSLKIFKSLKSEQGVKNFKVIFDALNSTDFKNATISCSSNEITSTHFCDNVITFRYTVDCIIICMELKSKEKYGQSAPQLTPSAPDPSDSGDDSDKLDDSDEGDSHVPKAIVLESTKAPSVIAI
jgi:hypothetical protein